MKILKIFILLILIVVSNSTLSSQRNTSLQDSINKVLVPLRYVIASNAAYSELKYYKRVEGLAQERLHNKDIVIQFYERSYNKCLEADSLNTMIILNKNEQLKAAFDLYKEEKRGRQLQKLKSIGLGVTLPVAIAVGFLIGFYLPH